MVSAFAGIREGMRLRFGEKSLPAHEMIGPSNQA
jgi:hypothetical protein